MDAETRRLIQRAKSNPSSLKLILSELLSQEFPKLEDSIDSIESWKWAHQGQDYCPRNLLPAYGGPGNCSDCDNYDSVSKILREFLEKISED